MIQRWMLARLSFIMSVYNTRNLDWLDSLESICVQSFGDFEIIICDDGSNGETQDRITAWNQRDPRIRIIRNETNRGLGYSLNRCLEAAAGEYVIRQDDDDVSSPERAERQVAFMQGNP